MNTRKLFIAYVLFVVSAFTQTSFAQGLNWEGQTGAFLTPFAYTAGSPSTKFGKPELAFHYLNGGNVIGNDYQLSITEGFWPDTSNSAITGALSSAGEIGAQWQRRYPASYLFYRRLQRVSRQAKGSEGECLEEEVGSGHRA